MQEALVRVNLRGSISFHRDAIAIVESIESQCSPIRCIPNSRGLRESIFVILLARCLGELS